MIVRIDHDDEANRDFGIIMRVWVNEALVNGREE